MFNFRWDMMYCQISKPFQDIEISQLPDPSQHLVIPFSTFVLNKNSVQVQVVHQITPSCSFYSRTFRQLQCTSQSGKFILTFCTSFPLLTKKTSVHKASYKAFPNLLQTRTKYNNYHNVEIITESVEDPIGVERQ